MFRRCRTGARTSVGLVALLAAAPLHAQTGAEVAEAQRANATALKRYTWKSRTEVALDGTGRSVQLFLVRYGADGALQKTRIGGTEPPEPPRGPLRRRIARKKAEDVQQLVRELGALAESYASLPPERMAAFLAKATVRLPLAGAASETVEIQGADVLRPGDSLTLWVERATRRQRSALVRTGIGEDAATIASEFRALPDGTTYAARVVLEYPREGLRLTIDNFDHEL